MAQIDERLLRQAVSLWVNRRFQARLIPILLLVASAVPLVTYHLHLPPSWATPTAALAVGGGVLGLLLLGGKNRFNRHGGTLLAVATTAAYVTASLHATAIPQAVERLLELPASVVHDLYWYDGVEGTGAVAGKSWERRFFGEIITVETPSDGETRLTLRTFRPYYGTILLTARQGSASRLRPGEVLEVDAVVYVPATSDNPGAFSYRRYLARQGIYLSGTVRSFQRVQTPTGVAGRLRQRVNVVRQRLAASFPNLEERNDSLLRALAFGQRDGVPMELEEKFRVLGVYHYLSVSGLHVGIVAGFVGFVSRFLGAGTGVAKLAALFGAWAFAILSGPAVPAARAALMLSLGLANQHFVRSRRSLHGLFVSALLLLTVRPLLIFDTGFQLSFAATAGVLLVVGGLSGPFGSAFREARVRSLLHRVCSAVGASLAVSVGAQLAILPMLLRYFGGIALFGPLHTLALLPLISVALLVGLFAGGVGLAFGMVPEQLQQLAAVPVSTTISYVEWASQLRGQFIPLGDPGIPVQVTLAGAGVYCGLRCAASRGVPPRLGALFRRQAARMALAVGIVAASGWLSALLHPTPANLSITFLSVGEGLAAFIRTPSGMNVLVDAGGKPAWMKRNASDFDIGRDIVVPYLRRRGVSRLDLVVMTHNHMDHIQGFEAVGRVFMIDRVAEPRLWRRKGEDAASFLFQVARARSMPQRYYLEAGDRVTLADQVELEVLNPVPGVTDGMDANDSSLVFRLRYGAFRLLMTADVETPAIEEIRQYWPQTGASAARGALSWQAPENWQADVMLIPHHGSGGAGHAELIDAVGPKVAIVSVGKNQFGHPDERLVDAVARSGKRLFRTDINGAVHIETDGTRFRAIPLRGATTAWLVAGEPDGSL